MIAWISPPPECKWICQSVTSSHVQVYYLSGIEKLLQLLCSDNEVVERFAAGALRNAVYQSNENKMKVLEKDGLATILQALKNSRDVETRRELTGQFGMIRKIPKCLKWCIVLPLIAHFPSHHCRPFVEPVLKWPFEGVSLQRGIICPHQVRPSAQLWDVWRRQPKRRALGWRCSFSQCHRLPSVRLSRLWN